MSEKEGIWIKYECGSDPKNIISYDGNNGDILCNVADYLEESDFYVYYTKDDDGNFTVPRLSIETNSNVHWKKDSTYVEGVGEDNNLEADMLDVLEEKLKEFPRNEYADLILHDAKMLTNIDEKDLKNIPLEKEEISFLYQIERSIEYAGYNPDKRIEEIISRRDIKQDMAMLYGCKKENVATSISDFSENNIIVYFDSLEYDGEEIPETFKNLMVILGDASFPNAESAENLQSLTYVKDYLRLPKIKSSKGLGSLQFTGGIYCNNMTDVTDLHSLETIKYSADFRKVKSAIGLEKLKYIGGSVDFRNLTSAIGLCNLESIGYELRHQDDGPFKRGVRFDSLVSADGFEKLKAIYICSDFTCMIDASAFGNCLEEVWDYINIGNLLSTEGLEQVKLVHPVKKSSSSLADKIKRGDDDKFIKVYRAK